MEAVGWSGVERCGAERRGFRPQFIVFCTMSYTTAVIQQADIGFCAMSDTADTAWKGKKLLYFHYNNVRRVRCATKANVSAHWLCQMCQMCTAWVIPMNHARWESGSALE